MARILLFWGSPQLASIDCSIMCRTALVLIFNSNLVTYVPIVTVTFVERYVQ